MAFHTGCVPSAKILKLKMNTLDDDKYYPRVLLVNAEPISRRYATGITMGNLFRGWPKDRIAQIYCDDSDPDTSICNKSWHLELEDLRMPGWLKARVLALRRQRKERADNQGMAVVVGGVRKTLRFRDYVVQTLKKWLFRCLEFSSYSVSPALDAWVADFSPEVIYSTLGNLHLLKLVHKLSDDLAIPVVPHFMDDWIVSLYSEGLLDKFLKFQLLKSTDHIMRDAPVMMVISEAMAEEYQKRYGRIFLPFMNCVEINAIDNVNRQIVRREEFRLVYTGGLHLGRWEMLLDIAQALSLLASSGIKAVFEIYTPNVPDDVLAKFSVYNAIRFCGAVPPGKVSHVLATCDGLIHIESFEEKFKAYTRFSISTKLPEYFSSGTALFAYGPEDLASFKYIEANNCGLIVGTRDQQTLIGKLREFIVNDVMRLKMAQQANIVCTKNHDGFSQRDKFRLAMTMCCNNS